MDINFELYKVFYEVANAKSISKGAEKLMISQPAVTQSIKTLEDELNGKLFIRTPKGVILTNEGEILYNYIKENPKNAKLELKNELKDTLNSVVSDLKESIKLIGDRVNNLELNISNISNNIYTFIYIRTIYR